MTVPAFFTRLQRQAIRDLARNSGLNVLRLYNEQTAAAIAYGFKRKDERAQNVLVFDLGGMNCSISILSIEDGIYEVKSISGSMHLGGEHFDARLIKYLMDEFHQKYSKDIARNKRAVQRLRTACISAKHTLSSASHARIEIDALFEDIDFYTSITRAKFEEINEDLFDSVLPLVEEALHMAEMIRSSIHCVLLIGGSTRIPKIVQVLHEFFKGKELNKSTNPDEAIAHGAGISTFVSSS